MAILKEDDDGAVHVVATAPYDDEVDTFIDALDELWWRISWHDNC
jgi:hypothetical protein